ncbi:metal-binding protein ZinT [Macrococcus capreoli]|uniref:metal-binding protein ZinT n=1 Tax=Macrococcus capreoli TaxID=2982690 RepID=UPI003EE5310A
MKKTLLTSIGLLSMSLLFAGCNTNDSTKDQHEASNETKTETKQEKHDSKEHTHDHKHEHHHHAQSKEQQQIYKGNFKDEQVKDRQLTDWEGDWQSVYPYLQDGTLDEVFKHKAETDHSKSEKEYKAYYTTGYKTDITRINIGEKKIAFYKGNEKVTGEYAYDGKEILNYKAGNRGVRFIFKKVNGDTAAPAYIQFSDHIIAPEKALHFHIYMGNDRAELLKELDHWPTYYPSDLSGHEIKDEMLAH